MRTPCPGTVSGCPRTEIVRGSRDQIAPSAIASYGGEENAKAQAVPTAPWVPAGRSGLARPSGKEDRPTTTTTQKPNQANTLARVQALIAGTQKHFPNGQFTLGNVAYTTATLVPALQSLADALTAVSTAHASVKDAITALKGVNAKIMPLVQAYRRYILAAFANATQELADFGMSPAKARAPRTSAQKAATAAKLRATRTARGTTSKKQKLTVHGDVTGVQITPITASANASQPAQPQPAAPPVSTASNAPAPATAAPAATASTTVAAK